MNSIRVIAGRSTTKTMFVDTSVSAKALCGNPGMIAPKAGTDKQEAKAIASALMAKLYQITSYSVSEQHHYRGLDRPST